MLQLYGHPLSANAQKIQLILAEIGIPYQNNLIDLAEGEQSQEHFLQVNPFGAVPAIVDDGFQLAESNAILRYLAQRYQDHAPGLYPLDLSARAVVDQMMDYACLHVSRWISSLHWHVVAAPLLGYESQQRVIDEASSQLARQLPKIDHWIEHKHPYLAGANYTIADISFAPFLAQMQQLPVEMSNHVPLCAYAERVLSRVAWKSVAEQIDHSLKELTQKTTS